MNITITPTRPFRSAWAQLADIGACDGLDSAEYLRALGDWIKARYSGTPRLWILAWQAEHVAPSAPAGCRSCDPTSNLPRRLAGCGCTAAAAQAQGLWQGETVTLWVPVMEG